MSAVNAMPILPRRLLAVIVAIRQDPRFRALVGEEEPPPEAEASSLTLGPPYRSFRAQPLTPASTRRIFWLNASAVQPSW